MGRPPKEPLKVPTWAARRISKLARESGYTEQQVCDDGLRFGLIEASELYGPVIKYRKNVSDCWDAEPADTEETVEGTQERPLGDFDSFPEPEESAEDQSAVAILGNVEVGPGQLAEDQDDTGADDQASINGEPVGVDEYSPAGME